MHLRFHASESGASEVVGEMLMLGITVTLFAILSVSVYSLLSHQDSAPIASITASMPDAGHVALHHSGGESIRYGDLSFIANGQSYNASSPSVSTGDSNNNGAWDIGETLTVKLPPGTGNVSISVYDKAKGSLLYSFQEGG